MFYDKNMVFSHLVYIIPFGLNPIWSNPIWSNPILSDEIIDTSHFISNNDFHDL